MSDTFLVIEALSFEVVEIDLHVLVEPSVQFMACIELGQPFYLLREQGDLVLVFGNSFL